MAEQPVVWNKKLLVVALILGVLAVALFYVYDSMKEQEFKGDVVKFLRWKRDLPMGTEVAAAEIEVVPVSRSDKAAYEGALRDTDSDWALATGPVQRNVRRSEPVKFADLLKGQRPSPADRFLDEGMRAFPITVDPLQVPGLLRPNDRIDLLGLVSLKGKPPRVFTLIQNIKVLALGGLDEEDFAKSGRSPGGSMGYRSITVQVKPKAAEQLVELLPRVQGKLTVILRPGKDSKDPWDGKINPELEPVLQQPLPEVAPAVGPAPGPVP